MKKFLALTLVFLTVLFAFCACGNGKNSESAEQTTVKEEPKPVFKDGYYYVVQEDSTAKIVDYKNGETPKVLEIPSDFDDIPVTVIGESAFEENQNIREVKIAPSVTTIEKRAFAKSSIYIANAASARSLVSIGDEAFADCKELVQVDVSSNVEKLGKDCFKNDSKLVVFTARGDKLNLDETTFAAATETSDYFKIWTYEHNKNVIKFAKDNSITCKILP